MTRSAATTLSTQKSATDMVHYYLNKLRDEDIDLGEAIYQLNLSLTSQWPDDLPRAVRELILIVESYRSTARRLIEDIEKAWREQASEEEQNSTLECRAGATVQKRQQPTKIEKIN
jgi:hypothetical protein